MLHIVYWLDAMTSAEQPSRPPRSKLSGATGRSLRQVVGQAIIGLGRALAGPDAVATRTASVGR